MQTWQIYVHIQFEIRVFFVQYSLYGFSTAIDSTLAGLARWFFVRSCVLVLTTKYMLWIKCTFVCAPHWLHVWTNNFSSLFYAFIPQHWLKHATAAAAQHTVCNNNSSFASLKLCCVALIWLRFCLSYTQHSIALHTFAHHITVTVDSLFRPCSSHWCTNPFVFRQEKKKKQTHRAGKMLWNHINETTFTVYTPNE